MNIYTKITRIVPSGVMVLAGALLLAGTAYAEPYTGCITPGGTIIHMAAGESPLKPCKSSQRLIHIDSEPASQHADAHYNPIALCRALTELGARVVDLEAMGCPIDPDAVAPGANWYQLSSASFNENGETCGGHGPVSIKTDPAWSDNAAHWVVQGADQVTGGAVIGKLKLILEESLAFPDPGSVAVQCLELCRDDPGCIASVVDVGARSTGMLRECRTFHYSEHVSGPWNEHCGPNQFFCQDSIPGSPIHWFLKADDCPGSEAGLIDF